MLHNPYSNHYHQIDKPPTPYNADIPNGLVPGKQIFISGNVHGDQIKIDFLTPNATALHINPRLNSSCIVRNSLINGGWGAEEKSGGMPFHRGQNFEVIVLIEEHQFRIAVNGQHFCEYKHRVSYRDVNRIHIYGDVQIHRLIFSGGASANPNEMISPPTPFAVPLVNGPNPGRMVQISGTVHPNAQRFAVNLQNGAENYPNDMAFHFNPRFTDGAPRVVKNSRRHGGWANEEIDNHSPFHPGAHFDMLILIDPSEFKVAVNGQHFTQLRHRNGLHDANTLAIDGDITIHAIRQY